MRARPVPPLRAAGLAELRRGAVGQRITLASDRFENPLYESCGRGVDYTDLRPRPRAEAEASLRPGPSVLLPGPGANGRHRPLRRAGKAANTVARFVFDRATGYYLFEGGAVLVLR